jgi:hypothetical protein
MEMLDYNTQSELSSNFTILSPTPWVLVIFTSWRGGIVPVMTL